MILYNSTLLHTNTMLYNNIIHYIVLRRASSPSHAEALVWASQLQVFAPERTHHAGTVRWFGGFRGFGGFWGVLGGFGGFWGVWGVLGGQSRRPMTCAWHVCDPCTSSGRNIGPLTWSLTSKKGSEVWTIGVYRVYKGSTFQGLY